MITFLLLIADIGILTIAYIGPRLALRNLAKKYNTKVKILLDNCANLECSYRFINGTFIVAIAFKVFIILIMLLVRYPICHEIDGTLITFIFLDSAIFCSTWAVESEDGGFYVKATDLKKLCRKSIKI